MYCQFYGLSEQPFNITPDSKFLFLSKRHQEALGALVYGIEQRKGFITLSGEIGSGKTTLYRTLLAQLDRDEVKTAIILNSYLSDLELLKTINEEFGLDSSSESKKTLLDHLNRFLVDQFEKKNNVVLIIDEAQNLRPETLEQVRMISNLETETDKLIQIMLIGQPQLQRTLALPELEQLNQRITVRHHLTPLSEDEVADYIQHRLRKAGAEVEIEFDPRALRLIYHYSKGVPRRINVICDRVLLEGYALGRHDIDGDMVERAVKEIRGESHEVHGAAGEFDDIEDPDALAKSGTPKSLKVALLGLAALVGGVAIVTGGVWLGLTLQTRMRAAAAEENARLQQVGEYAATGNGGSGSPLTFPVTETPAPEDSPATGGDVEAGSTTDPTTEPAEDATPKPTPQPTPFRYDPWEVDDDGNVRVQRTDHTEAASFVILLRQWGYDVSMETFRDAAPADVPLYDLRAMVAEHDFHVLPMSSLTEALKLDLPFMVRFDPLSPKLPPFGVIKRTQGDLIMFADPIRGARKVTRDDIEDDIRELVILYRDPDQLGGLSMGAKGDDVTKLQQQLDAAGYSPGKIDGVFGWDLKEALTKFQRDHKLPQSGEADRMTVAYLTSRADPDRPRLYS